MAKLLKYLPTLEAVHFWGDVRIVFKEGKPSVVHQDRLYNMDTLPTTPVRPVRASEGV